MLLFVREINLTKELVVEMSGKVKVPEILLESKQLQKEDPTLHDLRYNEQKRKHAFVDQCTDNQAAQNIKQKDIHFFQSRQSQQFTWKRLKTVLLPISAICCMLDGNRSIKAHSFKGISTSSTISARITTARLHRQKERFEVDPHWTHLQYS